MKQNRYCKKCTNSEQDDDEKILECKLLTPEERIAIIQQRHYRGIAEEFVLGIS